MNEIWKPIRGFEGMYEVSNLGRVRSLDRTRRGRWDCVASIKGRVMALRPDKDGYVGVNLTRENKSKNYKVHQLVAENFVENPLGLPEINHKDLNKANNHYWNLEYTTRKGNQLHAQRGGRFHAATNPNRIKKLTLSEVVAIRSGAAIGIKQQVLAKSFGVSPSAVWAILHGKSWREIAP